MSTYIIFPNGTDNNNEVWKKFKKRVCIIKNVYNETEARNTLPYHQLKYKCICKSEDELIASRCEKCSIIHLNSGFNEQNFKKLMSIAGVSKEQAKRLLSQYTEGNTKSYITIL